jgi:hypothetical protein
VKVARVSRSEIKPAGTEPPSILGPRGRASSLSEDFSMSIISGVRFAPLLRNPMTETVIPCHVWDPSNHRHYPKCFKESIKEIMLCSQAEPIQPPKVVVKQSNINVASTLPKDLWMKVLSYTHRSWFERPFKVDELLLRNRLRQEQETSKRAKEACADAERRLRLAERERDGYKLLAIRWEQRLKAILKEADQSSGPNNSLRGMITEEDQLLMMDDVVQANSFFIRLGSIRSRRRSQVRSQESSDEDDDESADIEDDVHNNDDGNQSHMDVESENEEDEIQNTNRMDDSSDGESDSEEFSLAGSPDTSDSSFYRQVASIDDNQAFFT